MKTKCEEKFRHKVEFEIFLHKSPSKCIETIAFLVSSFTKNTFLSAIWCSFDPTCAPLTLSRLRRHVCAPLADFGGVAPNAPLAPPPAAICSYAPLVFLQPPSAAFFKPRIFKTQCFSNPPPPAACAPMLLCSFEW